MAFKLGIVVGHTQTAGGAQGIGIQQEYTYNKAVAADMLAYTQEVFEHSGEPINAKLFFRNQGGVQGAYGRINNWMGEEAAAGLTVELHYNSFSSETVSGTETLTSGSPNSKRFAKLVQSKLCDLLGRTGESRGLKTRNRQNPGRGWLSLVSGIPPAILTEPCFGSSPTDAQLLSTKQFEIGRRIVDCAHDYFYTDLQG